MWIGKGGVSWVNELEKRKGKEVENKIIIMGMEKSEKGVEKVWERNGKGHLSLLSSQNEDSESVISLRKKERK